MRQPAAEAADGLELLGIAQRTLGITQQPLCLPLLGDVAGDLDEAEQLACFDDRLDDHAGTERRAIAAHPPAFTGDVTVLRCEAEQALRFPGFTIGSQIETAKVRADHFIG